MSVPKSKRTHGELEVLTKARSLKTYTLGICSNSNNFPKRYRWCVTNDIIKETCELCRLIVRANSIRTDCNEQDLKRRLLYQKQAYELTEVILEDIDTAYAFFRIPSKSIEYWTSLVTDIQSLLKGWTRKTKNVGNFYKSPNVGNANNVRNVNPSGENNNNSANNSNGVAPDFIKKPV